MYAVYKYIAGSNVTQICNDVVLMLTGTTNVNDLSASCDKANTSILTTWCEAGWTLCDASAGTNAQCIMTPWPDDPAKDGYVVVDTNSAGYILLKVYEVWNSETHVGTNACTGSTSTGYAQRINATTGGTLYISASPNHVVCYCYVGASFGSSSYYGASGAVFRTRRCLWDTVGNGYPTICFCNFSNANQGYFTCYNPRIRYYQSVQDVTGGSTQGYGAIMGFFTQEMAVWNSGYVGGTTAYYTHTANNTAAYAFWPISVQVKLANGWLGGDISASTCMYIGQALGNPLDIYTNGPGGAEYVMWGTDNTAGNIKLCIRRGL